MAGPPAGAKQFNKVAVRLAGHRDPPALGRAAPPRPLERQGPTRRPIAVIAHADDLRHRPARGAAAPTGSATCARQAAAPSGGRGASSRAPSRPSSTSPSRSPAAKRHRPAASSSGARCPVATSSSPVRRPPSTRRCSPAGDPTGQLRRRHGVTNSSFCPIFSATATSWGHEEVRAAGCPGRHASTDPRTAGASEPRGVALGPAGGPWRRPTLVGVFVLGATSVRFALPGSTVAPWWPAAGLAVCFLLATDPGPRRSSLFVLGVLVSSAAANVYGGRPPLVGLSSASPTRPRSPSCYGLLTARRSATRGSRRWKICGASSRRPSPVRSSSACSPGSPCAFGLGGTSSTRCRRRRLARRRRARLRAARHRGRRPPHPPPRRFEDLVQWIVVVGVTFWVFHRGQSLPLAFLPIPGLVWGALRLGLRTVAVQLIVVGVLTVRLTIIGGGPFAAAARRRRHPSGDRRRADPGVPRHRGGHRPVARRRRDPAALGPRRAAREVELTAASSSTPPPAPSSSSTGAASSRGSTRRPPGCSAAPRPSSSDGPRPTSSPSRTARPSLPAWRRSRTVPCRSPRSTTGTCRASGCGTSCGPTPTSPTTTATGPTSSRPAST